MITIYDGTVMHATAPDGRLLASAVQVAGEWMVTNYAVTVTQTRTGLDRNQAISALMLVERLAGGYGDDDPEVQALRLELNPNWRRP